MNKDEQIKSLEAERDRLKAERDALVDADFAAMKRQREQQLREALEKARQLFELVKLTPCENRGMSYCWEDSSLCITEWCPHCYAYKGLEAIDAALGEKQNGQ